MYRLCVILNKIRTKQATHVHTNKHTPAHFFQIICLCTITFFLSLMPLTIYHPQKSVFDCTCTKKRNLTIGCTCILYICKLMQFFFLFQNLSLILFNNCLFSYKIKYKLICSWIKRKCHIISICLFGWLVVVFLFLVFCFLCKSNIDFHKDKHYILSSNFSCHIMHALVRDWCCSFYSVVHVLIVPLLFPNKLILYMHV